MSKDRGYRLKDVDLSPSLKLEAYEPRLLAAQRELALVQQAYVRNGGRAVIVFEGWDAAGKGGVIRRISQAMDPRSFSTWSISAPGADAKRRHYLARFWNKLPPDGSIAVFDRSWYGRVLVERVEGYATDAEWRRAYQEITEFERLLVDDGARILKFFIHISPEEQAERFRKRYENPAKRWKLTLEDFRNREKGRAYADAIDDMFAKTDTEAAPWRVIAGECKRHARVTIMETIIAELSDGVDLAPPPLDPEIVKAAKKELGV